MRFNEFCELINEKSKECLFLVSFKDMGDGKLLLTICSSLTPKKNKTDEIPLENVPRLLEMVSDSLDVEPNPKESYVLIFDHVLAYSVIDEYYAEQDKRIPGFNRISVIGNEDSEFLDYVKKMTIAKQINEDNIIHVEICLEGQVINVATYDIPSVLN